MTKRQSTNNKKPARAHRNWAGMAGWLAAAALALLSMGLLLGAYGNYMRKVEALSLFVPTASYYQDFASVPGGPLSWCGAFLTQFMYYPALGALIFTALLLAIQFVASRAFRLKGWWAPLAAVPAAAVLLVFVSYGYDIFTLKPIGYAFALPIGVLFALCCAWACSALRRWWWLRAVIAVAVVALGYSSFGFFALLAGGLCALASGEWKMEFHFPLTVAVTALAICLTPKIWYAAVGGNLMPSQMYVSGLPRLFVAETGMRVRYAVVFGSLGLLALLWPLLKEKLSWCGPALCAASLVAVPIFRCSDSNLMLTLDLDRAIWQQDWQQASSLALSHKGPLTRLNTDLAYLAMMRQGSAGGQMFAVNNGWAEYGSERTPMALQPAGAALISYHLGLINYAYRWGTEYMIEQGLSVERMKLLAKCALLNGETGLAEKYLDIIYNTMFHRPWAEKYMRYLTHPMEMMQDAEMRDLSMIMMRDNEFINDGGSFEGYVWPALAATKPGNPESVELSMQAALICWDLDAFMAKLPYYRQSVQGPMPRYYQEAALLWSKMAGRPCPIPIDPAVEQRHTQFFNAFQSTKHMEPEAQREAMREGFDDTYWFYFVFLSNMPMM
ncbi:MAG: hypothetical protein K2N16_02855 [Muribaculaceae bacterium]|nr:hypothetical protein [Muribaculaceae bacterium]